MPTSIDHIVIVVRDLAQASANYERLGFTVTPGGEHTGGATHNVLISFADGAYIELIAFREPDRPQGHRWWPRLAKGEGLVDYALLSDDLAAEVDAVRSRGLECQDPVDGGRLRPDGLPIAWRSLMLQRVVGESALPFLIEDITPRNLRVPGPPATDHRLGVTRVAGLTLLVRDLGHNASALEKVLGTAAQPTSSTVEGAGPAARFQVGPHWLELVEPAAGPNPLQEHLLTYNNGPYELVLSGKTGAEPGAGDLLDPVTAHGARIRIAL